MSQVKPVPIWNGDADDYRRLANAVENVCKSAPDGSRCVTATHWDSQEGKSVEKYEKICDAHMDLLQSQRFINGMLWLMNTLEGRVDEEWHFRKGGDIPSD